MFVGMDQRIYQIALGIVNGLGPIGARKLVDVAGSAEAIFKSRVSSFRKIEGLRSNQLDQLQFDRAVELR